MNVKLKALLYQGHDSPRMERKNYLLETIYRWYIFHFPRGNYFNYKISWRYPWHYQICIQTIPNQLFRRSPLSRITQSPLHCLKNRLIAHYFSTSKRQHTPNQIQEKTCLVIVNLTMETVFVDYVLFYIYIFFHFFW